MSGCKTDEEREFYIRLCIKENYSKRQLERQLDSGYYERYMLSKETLLPESVKKLGENPFLDSYVMEFLDLPNEFHENDFRIDLLFYHRGFCDWLKTTFGTKSFDTNMDFIAKALGNKGDTSREVIRNYFLNVFFKDHCNTYSVTGSGKRPIYWLFDSGKQNGFKALIYMHCYDADTVGRVRTDYLHKAQKYVETAMQSAQYTLDNATSSSEKSKATKSITKYTK